MEVIDIRVMRGPNYWSNYRKKLIVVKLNLLQFEYLPTNIINGFNDQLKTLIPSLYNHRCSFDHEGGFFIRLAEGTWLGHVIEHVALELQWLAGMKCGFGRTRSTYEKGIYHVVFSYEIEDAGLYAAHAAIKLVKNLANQQPYLGLVNDIEHLNSLYEKEKLGPSTEAIIIEAERQHIPWTAINHESIIRLGYGCYQKIIHATVTSQTNIIAADIARDKSLTKKILAANEIPVPNGRVIQNLDQLDDAINEVGFPLVVKPADGNHGKGITANLDQTEKIIDAFHFAKQFSSNVMLENFIKGSDYRFLVINFKVVAIAMRIPARIVGDGVATIWQLIDGINQHPHRSSGHSNYLSNVSIDEITQKILAENNFTLNSILPEGQILTLKYAANISSGGTAIDVTEDAHPYNIFLAERIARLINLDICGIDIVAQDICEPITAKTGAVLEVNAGPGFRMHLRPTEGQKRDIGKPVIEMLYPENSPSRIPIIAVTGTNGKTTTVRLIAYMASCMGYKVGFTTTEGIMIGGQEIYHGDCSGPQSAMIVLRDPLINFAVFECARGGILRAGLGFDHCYVSVVLNISSDHLGLDDIETLEDLARVKSVVPRSTLPNGFAVLNADDHLVYAMKKDLSCQIALFSINANNERIKKHCMTGGLVAYLNTDTLFIQHGTKKQAIAKLTEIPLTFSGKASCQIQNVLSAVLVAYINEFPLEKITECVMTFQPSWKTTPGRMNFFEFDTFRVLVDYAHNEAAFQELQQFLNTIDEYKVGIIGATGDRRPSDISKIGYYAAQMFDEIIIRHDQDSRGKSNEELTKLIMVGIHQHNTYKKVNIISNELDAIKYAMAHAKANTLIVYFPDKVLEAVAHMTQVEAIWLQNKMQVNTSTL